MQASSSRNAPSGIGRLEAYSAALLEFEQTNRARLVGVGRITTTASAPAQIAESSSTTPTGSVSAQATEWSSKNNGKGKGRDSKSRAPRVRKKRTLKDLVRVCEELGDTSDKSHLLAEWKSLRKDQAWKELPPIVRLRNMIHRLVLKLEQFSRELETEGGASGKVRNVARERYWEADSPLTNPENPLKEDVPVSHWTALQVESWALYLEAQLLFASVGVRVSLFHDLVSTVETEDEIATQFWVDAMNRLFRHPNHNLGSASDIIDTHFGDDWDSTYKVSNSDTVSSVGSDDRNKIWYIGYTLRADIEIPITRFASRICLELQRMSEIPRGRVRAFSLALMLRMDVLGTRRLALFANLLPLKEIEAFLFDQIGQERDNLYPELPLDFAQAFLYLDYFGCAESDSTNTLVQLASLIDAMLPLVSRDLRREYRRNLNLAFGRRLPPDVYEEIVDHIEDAHALPKSLVEWNETIHYGQVPGA